ncbi:probable serine/threonine-protein kinase At1g54610 isoform X2 [Cryptomeria japonica]|uniref:probable serine/threonine-protein kinase At1g54610 isoform X2 n=1 Tax=Cryptomeria japonica TaxID=3369 RepID=UPI0025AC140B|nr:probable serine/threonine-protein kinase At1g54610 isoform X2 [Cryptomeria japonica]
MGCAYAKQSSAAACNRSSSSPSSSSSSTQQPSPPPPPKSALVETANGSGRHDNDPHAMVKWKWSNREAEQVAAGWPSWLTAVAAEAIQGWIPRRADAFQKLDKIGQGTYSNVYKACDLDTGKVVALKKVRFDNLEPESVRFMAREIQVLRRLDHPNVVKLEGLVTSRMSCSLYLVFEYMDHDLAGLAACPGIKFSEAQVKCYIQQLLSGLDHCHVRGVLHRDIKGSNLLIDNQGILKIADFGLATFFSPGQKQPLTSRVVTLWYRPPELLLGATDYGVGVDLWSTGCILAELLAGKPILPGRTEFFTTKPFACDPSSLPKYPPSKEFDVKIRDDEARRKRAIGGKGRAHEAARRISRESRAVPAPDGNAELATSIQKRRMVSQAASKSNSEKFNSQQEDSAVGFPIEPPRAMNFSAKACGNAQTQILQNGGRSSDPMSNPRENGLLQTKNQNEDDAVMDSMWAPSRTSKSLTKHEPKLQSAYGSLARENLSNISISVAATNATDAFIHKDGRSLQQCDDGDKIGKVGKEKHQLSQLPEHSMIKELVPFQPPESDYLNKFLLQDVSTSNCKRDERQVNREPFMGYSNPEERVEYSGPLVPQSTNIDEILEKHERQIQQAVRRAQQQKGKIQKKLDCFFPITGRI